MEELLIGVEAVARHFGVAERTVYRWIREGMPRLPANKFSPLQIQEWRERKKGILRPARTMERDSRQRDFYEAPAEGKEFHEERLKKHKADLAEMEVRQRRAELVEIRELKQLFVGRWIALKQAMLTFSRGLPPRLIHCKSEREMEVVIMRSVQELLDNFSQDLPKSLGGAAVESDPEDEC